MLLPNAFDISNAKVQARKTYEEYIDHIPEETRKYVIIDEAYWGEYFCTHLSIDGDEDASVIDETMRNALLHSLLIEDENKLLPFLEYMFLSLEE